MKSHELAKLLLTLPDLPVATHANNHSNYEHISSTRENIYVGYLVSRYTSGEQLNVVIGNWTPTPEQHLGGNSDIIEIDLNKPIYSKRY